MRLSVALMHFKHAECTLSRPFWCGDFETQNALADIKYRGVSCWSSNQQNTDKLNQW